MVTTRRSELTGPRTSAVRAVELPEPGYGEVLLKVLVSGVCASEVADWTAGPSSGAPLALGHEPVGEVVAVGPDVTAFAAGDLVTGRVDASFADHAIGDVRDLVPVPAGVEPVEALGEPLGCVVEALRRTRLDTGDRVAVVGTGFMGLVLLQLLRHAGTRQVVAIDPRPDAREQALVHGADSALAPGEVSSSSSSSGDFDVVVEASGTAPGLDLATTLVRPHGVLSIMGYHQGPRTVDLKTWNWKAIDVVNAHVRDRDRLRESVRRGLDLVAAGRIDVGALITHRFTLDEVDAAFEALVAKEPGFVKAALIW